MERPIYWIEKLDARTKRRALQTLHYTDSRTQKIITLLRSMRPVRNNECVTLPVCKVARLISVGVSRCIVAAFAARIAGVVDQEGVLRLRLEATLLRRMAVLNRV
jgi:hypothetical protein|eukprot:2839169-Prymnesium_polylepis.1